MSLLAHVSPWKVSLWPRSAHLPEMLYPIREIYFYSLPFERVVFPSIKKLGVVVRWGQLFVGGEEEERVAMWASFPDHCGR